MNRCNFKEAFRRMIKLEPFKNWTGNLYAEHVGDAYVVYSFGDHWPLLVFVPGIGAWINDGRYGARTDRHATLVRQAYPAAYSTDVCGLHHVLKNLPLERARQRMAHGNDDTPRWRTRQILTCPLETT